MLTKNFMDTVKKGDIKAIQAEQEKLGIHIPYLIDENYKHNAIFYALLIKDEAQSLKVVEYLIS